MGHYAMVKTVVEVVEVLEARGVDYGRRFAYSLRCLASIQG